MSELIRAEGGGKIYTYRGASSEVVATFSDCDNVILDKDGIESLTATLINSADNTIINGRSNQDVIDANGGLLSEEGVLELLLGPLDNVLCSSGSPSKIESHILILKWTYYDSRAVPVLRTGVSVYEIQLEKTLR